MKLTIWQQFSSNHSASFTVVGKFETPEKAEEAAKTVRDVIHRIGDYYRSKYPDHSHFWEFVKQKQLSTVEESIKEEFLLDTWVLPLDWIYFDKVEDVVIVFHNLLFVNNNWDTWIGQTPIGQLVQYLGGEVAVSTEGGSRESYLMISCEAPNVEIAIQLEKSLIKEQFYVGNHQKTLLGIPNTSLDDFSLLERRDRTLSLERWAWGMKRHLPFLTAYVRYLQDNGCTNFKYNLREETNFNDSNPKNLS